MTGSPEPALRFRDFGATRVYERDLYGLCREIAPVRTDRAGANKKCGLEMLESFAHTDAPGMIVLALSEINAQIYVILLT
jgi:hypothetical protein